MGLIELAQDDAGLVTKGLLTLGLVILCLSCAYIYCKPAKIQISGSDVEQPTPSKQAEKLRCLALAGMIAIPILTVTGFFEWQHFQNLPSKNIIVLVADFEGPDPKNYRATEKIIEQLYETTRKYPNIKIQALNKPITEQEGNKHKTNIVIWGRYRNPEEKVLLSVHFEVLELLQKSPISQLQETESRI